ncbi:type IV secretion protein Rhs [Flavobacterium sp. MR2016-29]|uniref:DUF6443 domain-containing protein n=1 Tax=Flavobacterium sp. MR2016-29 TaxID=2783795 RepID=UPI00188A5D67|nr:DUF6443 domain-containing protein [Flavobacterium sp. MR2016-29]MBF4494091.1 type IV secretion protein Rhs [Flavobacterium sp. MR2016-29]
MKKYIPILILFLLAEVLTAQTFSDNNFIYTAAPKKPVQAASFNTLTKDDLVQTVTYFDGLGRPIQTIKPAQGGSGQDIVTPIEYDGLGRQAKDYLPYAVANGGNYYPLIDPLTAVNADVAFYNNDKYENTSNPFSEKRFESSPLNRVLKQAAPGTSWKMESGHEIKLDYQTNTSNDAVKKYTATAEWQASLGLYEITFSNGGSYEEKELYKNVTYDENSNANPSESSGSTIEFKNKEGQIVLKRSYESGDRHDTYYVYDIYGNLTYVIPPKADGVINDEVLNGLCYQYKYDNRNRLVEKKLPGKQWEFIVYDKLDRPVATGPALSPFKDNSAIGWIITKYDAFSRPIYTGWSSQTSNSVTRKSLQDAQNTATVLYEYKTPMSIDGISTSYNNSIEPTSFKLLTVNYYDDYSFPDAQPVPSSVIGQTVLTNVKGLPTGSWTRVLTTASSIEGETATVFYDQKGRVISNYQKNHLGGVNHTDNELDFTGKTLTAKTEHQRSGGAPKITIEEKLTYSAQDRLLTHTHKIGEGTPQLLADNTYDEMGQLMTKKVGNSTGNPLQKVDFNYNIRGWLTAINETGNLDVDASLPDLFAFKINYDKPSSTIVKDLYNGNISETIWETSDHTLRSYRYEYDKLNRLTAAVYAKPASTIPVSGAYNESISYDKNGNIKFLTRFGGSDMPSVAMQIDDLTYGYLNENSNLLVKVTDGLLGNDNEGFKDGNKGSDDFAYDANGNMISDKNKNITEITYNHLNLPKKIVFATENSIEYIYTASGQKLEKIVKEGLVTTTTNYLGGFQYKDNNLEFFPTAEGYVKNNGGTLAYVFQYKDHLGNIRLSYTKGAQGEIEIIDEAHYYPFGLKHEGYVTLQESSNKYKFLGQERQDELGLNWDTFRHRNYDYAIGRFFGVDPVSEEYMSISTYQFAHNNPVWKVEIEGLEGAESNGKKDVTNHESVKVKNTPVQGFVGGGLIETKVIQKTTTEVVKEVTTETVKAGGKVLGKVVGTIFAVLTDYMSPNYGGRTSEMPLRNDFKIDEKLSIKDHKVGEKTIEETGIKRHGNEKEKENRYNHIFGKEEHDLDSFVQKLGSEDKAYDAVQKAANEALANGELSPNSKGILPNGDKGNIITVNGMQIRLIGGRVSGDQVKISSFSRKGL